MIKALVATGLSRNGSPRQHVIDMHGYQSGIHQYSLGSSGMNPLAMDSKLCGGSIKVLVFDTSFISTVKSVGVMGDERTYEHPVALRAVTSTDAMTADWAHLPYDFMAKVSNEIINKVKGVNRVCYDISSKPPSTIEWE